MYIYIYIYIYTYILCIMSMVHVSTSVQARNVPSAASGRGRIHMITLAGIWAQGKRDTSVLRAYLCSRVCRA